MKINGWDGTGMVILSGNTRNGQTDAEVNATLNGTDYVVTNN